MIKQIIVLATIVAITNGQDLQRMRLTSICNEADGSGHRWRVTNPENFTRPFEWQKYGSGLPWVEENAIGDDVTYFTATDGTMRIRYDRDGLPGYERYEVKASNTNVCQPPQSPCPNTGMLIAIEASRSIDSEEMQTQHDALLALLSRIDVRGHDALTLNLMEIHDFADVIFSNITDNAEAEILVAQYIHNQDTDARGAHLGYVFNKGIELLPDDGIIVLVTDGKPAYTGKTTTQAIDTTCDRADAFKEAKPNGMVYCLRSAGETPTIFNCDACDFVFHSNATREHVVELAEDIGDRICERNDPLPDSPCPLIIHKKACTAINGNPITGETGEGFDNYRVCKWRGTYCETNNRYKRFYNN